MKSVDNIRVYEGDTVYFEDWLKENGYFCVSEIRDRMVYEGNCQEEIDDAIDELYDEFCEWADDKGLTAMYS